MLYLHIGMCAHVCSALKGQKRMSGVLGTGFTDSGEPSYGC